ncbi:MAG: Fe-S protein assembly co-chaperone HscB [Pseudomonadota bacterium]|jgi:molecular chaperone HscB
MLPEPSAALRPDLRLDDHDFALFDLPLRQAQDLAEIDRRWKALQTQVHPDRFASQGAAAQRLAMQWAVRVNEAHQRLKDPLKRATQLCELHGAPVDAERNTAMPAAFLMQQMEWRESLDEARGAPALEALADAVLTEQKRLHARLADTIDQRADWPAAAALVRALMFVRRFADDIDQRLAELDT